MTGKANLAASVAARLLNRAKATGDDYQTLLTSYCFERFLYRLGAPELRDRFVLKGAMLLRVWSTQPYRATRDLDLLRRGDPSFDAIRDDIRVINSMPVEPDGISFDGDPIHVEAVRAEDEYAGARAMVVLGDRNSRIKDFFDLHHLATHFEFDRATLAETVRRTFQRRNTPIPRDPPIGLTQAYWDNPTRPAQVRAFARRARLLVGDAFAEEFTRVLDSFLSPVLEDVATGERRRGTWPPGGAWRMLRADFGRTLLAGGYNLLLGSGISLDSKNARGEHVRGVEQLRQDLCRLVGVDSGTSLNRVYPLLSPEQRRIELVERFTNCVPAASLAPLSKYIWRRLFTFNIDDVLEAHYAKAPRPKQELRPANYDAPFEPTPDRSTLQAIHLHGWAQEPATGFVFSATEYARVMRDLNPWMHLLAEILATEPFIIAGSSLNEADLEF